MEVRLSSLAKCPSCANFDRSHYRFAKIFSKMAKKGQKRPKKAKKAKKRPKMAKMTWMSKKSQLWGVTWMVCDNFWVWGQNWPKGPKMAKNGPKWPKMAQMSEKWLELTGLMWLQLSQTNFEWLRQLQPAVRLERPKISILPSRKIFDGWTSPDQYQSIKWS